MKKMLVLLGTLTLISACTDVEGYETDISTLESSVEELSVELTSVSEDKDKINEEKEKLDEEIIKIKADKEKLNKTFDDYKKRMEPYEDLEKSESEARKLEADRILAEEKAAEEKKKEEEKAAEEKKKAEEEAAKLAEQEATEKAEEERIAKGYETGLTYDQLARTPDDYIGEKIKFSGKVVQVIEGTDEIQLRFAINDDYDQVIYVGYSPDIVDQRVLEDDYLTIYGYSVGTISYESTLGGNITIPASYIEKIDFN